MASSAIALDRSFSIAGSATAAFPITPSDTDQLPVLTRYIYVGGTGNGDMTVVMADYSTVTFKGVAAGSAWLPLRVRQIKATGTSGTLSFVGLY